MNAPFSPYLNRIAPGLKKVIAELRLRYDYVSVLSTDSTGFQVSISRRAKSVSRDTLCTERGTVVRVYRNGLYAESAFTGFDPAAAEQTAKAIAAELDSQLDLLRSCEVKPYETGILPDEPRTLFVEMKTGRMPEEEDISALVDKLTAVSDRGLEQGRAQGLNLIDFTVRATSTHICKMFLTEHQDLRQSYVYSEGMAAALVEGEEKTDFAYTSQSERFGPELFDHAEDRFPRCSGLPGIWCPRNGLSPANMRSLPPRRLPA